MTIVSVAMLAGYQLAAQEAPDIVPDPSHRNAAIPSSALNGLELPSDAPLPTTDGKRSPYRMREGTQLSSRLGRFRLNGELLVFIDEEGRELGGLPNLNLERVIRMLKTVEDPEGVAWSVSGAVTEFAGRNYLLISRAVYKAASAPPVPDVIE